ncbi:MAG: thiolase domain-containing protein [Candidatus Hecatellales archaeon]|nr:MAG: thiolase domain-containing protein [Candidatus Hecatellales archaeon]
MRRVAVVGVGMTKFGVLADKSLREMAFEAFKEALEDANLAPKDIESVYTAINADHFSSQVSPGASVMEYLGLNPKPNIRIEAACASSSAAIRLAWLDVASGLHDIALALGVEKMNEAGRTTAEIIQFMGTGGDITWENHYGPTFPGFYAIFAINHMHKYGTTKEQLAMVAVKNHYYGAMNPKAHFQREITLEQALKSPMISYPLQLYDCCPISDGAACAILASEDVAKKISDTPIWITGLGLGTSSVALHNREDYATIPGTVEAAKQAYKMARVEPRDVDVACVHDCFTIAEIMAYEDLGFCKKGEGGKLIEEKQTYIGGKIPVNVDGGLKAKGHPTGATGAAMTYEIVKQLRGEAGKRQVPNAEIGLTHNVGAHGTYVCVHIYRR